MAPQNPTQPFRQIRFGSHRRRVLETLAAFARRRLWTATGSASISMP